MKPTVLRACVVLVTLLVTAAPALAQTPRAVVRGVIVDQTGGRLPGAEVRVTDAATNAVRSTIADAEGRFALPELPPGRYTIEAELSGFSAFRRAAQLAVGQELWLEVQLQVSAVLVELSHEFPYPPALQYDSPALTTRLFNHELTNLPLDGRNFLELALLTPGTAPAPQGSASSVRGDFAFTANGAREDFNNYLLDGVYNIDPKLNTVGVRPAVDAIQEFEVASSSYDAAYGRNGGAHVNVITRSGANRCYGSLYEFFRNGALDARNFFAPANEPAPDYNRHQFGGSIGGPVTRDRIFFFGDYEGTRLEEGVTRVTTVPTLAERRGDFSQSARPPFNFLTGQPFPGGQIPSFFQHPVGAAIAALYPEPNRGGTVGNFVSSPTLRDDVDQFDTRLDFNLTNASRLTMRYSFSDRRLLEPFAGPAFSAVPGFGNEVARRGQNLGVTHTHVLGPRAVNDLRFGYNRAAIGVFAENTAITNQSVGLPALSSNPRDAGLSLVSIAGYSPLGHEYNNPQESASDAYQISDTVTLIRGAHMVKAGADWYGVRQSAYRDVQARGFLTFVGQGYTGNALADLLLGLPVVTGGARLDNPQHLRSQTWSAYVHDDWRASSALTISAGLRYDYASPPADADDRANLYDLATGQVVPVGTSGMPRGGFEGDRNNIAPRAGFAWTIDKSARTVLRGGYGIYYNQGALAPSEGLFFNPPYFNLGVYFPAQGLPPLTLTDPFPASFPVFIPQSATAYQRDLQTPWMQHWNVNLQREIGSSRAIEIAYVASRGHDLLSARDANQPVASPAQPNLRPNPLFADVTLIESRGSSRYNALQLKFQQRATAGLTMLGSYTLGKSTDDASGFFTSAGDPNFPQNSLDPGAEHGRSSFDVRHRLSLSVSYALPVEGNVWLDNWELHGILTLQSGRPFTVAVHPDIDISNTGRSNLGFGNNDRPNVSGDPSLDDPAADRWFNTAAFAMPAFGTFGNARRNMLEGPGYQNVNLAVVKSVPVRAVRLQFRAEAFNLFNRVNLDLPDAFLGSPTFGRILSAQSPRRIQFGVKALF
jgi:hypothetical protein